MLCTFCGTENRPEYKFCGTCGVRMERRQVERRTTHAGSTKCASCGHVNEPGMKFCGMCGTRVDRRTEERRSTGDEERAVAIANAQLPSPDVTSRGTTRVVAPAKPLETEVVALPRNGETAIFRNESGNVGRISGPSFLGLNSQPDSNGDVEYLLEDEPSGGGLRKLLLLVILAAILGLLFVQWRSSFKASPKSAPAKSDPSTPTTPPQGSNQPANAPGTSTSDSPKVAADGANANSTSAAAESKAPRTEPTALETTSSAPSTPGTEESADAAKSPDADKALPDSDGKPDANDRAATDTKAGSVAKATEEARIPDYKPSAALVRAQQYIRGAGVQQNCEQGLLYLKAATDKSDPGADIQMAALYSSGICVKQDRVMAYRWFNSAHELQPANVWIQRNMDQLWAQMSTQERRLAGY
jgi:Double zinc ribbon